MIYLKLFLERIILQSDDALPQLGLDRIDMLKIDGNIIGDVVNDPVQQTIVAGIVAVAGKMDVRVVAEFVADEYMQETLRNLGVSFVQGYHVGRPRPWADVIGT